MTGGGGGRFSRPTSPHVREQVAAAQERESERLKGEVNELLRDLLAGFNARDVEKTRERLEEIREALAGEAEIEEVLYGGSVAKRTAVDGLSDVDALAVLDTEEFQGVGPKEVLEIFMGALRDGLSLLEVDDIKVGDMAVSVRYRDGEEIQFLPVVRTDDGIKVPMPGRDGWRITQPEVFRGDLSEANERMNHALVPTIKLMKAAIARLPESMRLTGYHIESLAIDASRKYDGVKVPRALLLHLLDHAAHRVRSPIPDITGQSKSVDEYLGSPDSASRLKVSLALGSMGRRLAAATSLHQWVAVLGLDVE